MAALSTILLATGLAVEGAKTVANINAANDQAEFEQAQNEFNAKISDLQSQDALERGDQEAISLMREATAIKGSQRASAAAQGVVVDQGSNLDLQNETQQMAAEDVNRIKMNAIRESFGYKTQALGFRQAGEQAQKVAANQVESSILSAGANAVSMAGNYYKGTQEAKRRSRTTGEKY